MAYQADTAVLPKDEVREASYYERVQDELRRYNTELIEMYLKLIKRTMPKKEYKELRCLALMVAYVERPIAFVRKESSFQN